MALTTPNASRQSSLWDVDDVSESEVKEPGELDVRHASRADVAEFLHRYHYLRIGGMCQYNWGLWDGPILYGIVSYNIPTRDACECVYGESGIMHVWHMTRLAAAEHAPPNSESRLIGGSLRAIQRERPDIWAVLTYADADMGHVGYVYQATNAIYTGMAGYAQYYLDKQGNRHGTYDGRFINAARAQSQYGWTVHKGQRKHRYVYILGSKRQRRQRRAQLRLPVVEYPKAQTDALRSSESV